MKKKLLFFICYFTTAILCCCKTSKFDNPTLYGMIYDNENEPVSDVSVFIDNKEKAISDIYGHFQLNDIKLNKSYTLKASKKGYDDTYLEFSFTNISQVAYIRMLSSSELLLEVEKKISEKEYHDALNLLTRAEKIDGLSLSIMYLKSVIYYLSADYEKALSTVELMLQKNYNEAYVYLLLADIHQFGFNDIATAKKYLQLFLNKSYNPDVQQRLSNLE